MMDLMMDLGHSKISCERGALFLEKGDFSGK